MKRYFASVLMSSVLLCAPARAETIFEALGEAYSSNPERRLSGPTCVRLTKTWRSPNPVSVLPLI